MTTRIITCKGKHQDDLCKQRECKNAEYGCSIQTKVKLRTERFETKDNIDLCESDEEIFNKLLKEGDK